MGRASRTRGLAPFVVAYAVADPAAAAGADFRFLRFQVEFDFDALGSGISTSTAIPSFDFLRVPFRY
jgi:hypothetical protein